MSVHDLIVRSRRIWHKSVSRPWVHLTRPFRRRFFMPSSRSGERLKLLDELSALFLSDVIKERVSYLAERDVVTPPLQQAQNVRQGYASRLASALATESGVEWEVTNASADHTVPNLAELRVFGRLGLKDFRTPGAFSGILRRLDADVLAGRFIKRNELAIAGVLLRGLQKTALSVVSEDYPRSTVPPPTQQAIRDLLATIERLSRTIRPTHPPLPYQTADAVLRVAEARSEGRVWLPLRPIPTAALSFEDKQQKYPGRSDEDAHRLARQIRHADGAILTTGYRGVGKSTFINRVLYHTLAAQSAATSSDEWLVVPVTISTAKVVGVKSILRSTVKAVHTQLLNPDATPRPIPGRTGKLKLPLTEDERALLQAAYERSTLKVALTREEAVEQKREVGASFKLDPGKLIGVSLGKFVSVSGSRSRIEKVNRQLSLLDYDENAAEEDLSDLIRRLAQQRPLRRGGPNVRIKLVFIFDELDKMDIERGLKPMIEGLKNLFLQQHAVFILITSKKFYYKLLGDRAKEDEILNSYFSAIVHVPLLTYAEVRKILEHWIDTDAVALPAEPSNNPEARLLDLLARFLTYRSLGNPREIIRELRQMEVWAESGGCPYLTDRITQLPEVPIFAAIQEAIELVAAPPASSSNGPDGERGVTLVSERLKSDQARFEQLRRGLYILAGELINRSVLSLRAPDLRELIRNNFSQISPTDVLQIASRLGNQLKALSANLPLDVFASLVAPGQSPLPFELFSLEREGEGETVKATDEFYTLIGRRPSPVEPVAATAAQKQIRTIEELIADAQSLANHGGRAERSSAINIIGEILKEYGATKTPDDLKVFLLEVVSSDPDSVYRQAAADRLRPEILFNTPGFDLMGRIRSEADERVLSNLISLLGTASAEQDRKVATEALLELLGRETAAVSDDSPSAPKLTDDKLIDLLTRLQTVTRQDITEKLLEWITRVTRPDVVMSIALRTLNTNASASGIDLTDRLLAIDSTVLESLLSRKHPGGTIVAGATTLPGSQLLWRSGSIEKWLLDTLSPRPGESAERLLAMTGSGVVPLLASLWEVAIERSDPVAAGVVVKALALSPTDPRFLLTRQSLALVGDFSKQALPYLKESLTRMSAEGVLNADQAAAVQGTLDSIAKDALFSVADYLKPNTALDLDRIFRNVRGSSESPVAVANTRVWPRVTCSVAGLLGFAATFFLFRDSLAERGMSAFVLTRAGMLLIDAVAFAVLASIIRSGTRVLSLGVVKGDDVSPNIGSSYGGPNASAKLLWSNFSIFAILGLTHWLHQKLDGSLTEGRHAAILVLNLAATGLLSYGLLPLFRKR